MLVWINRLAFVWTVVVVGFAFYSLINGEATDDYFKECTIRKAVVGTKVTDGKRVCIGCEELRNCTIVIGSVQLKGIKLENNKDLQEQITFPRLREITGHLIVTYLLDVMSLSDILPGLTVIHGQVKDLFRDYSLVVYQNDGLETLGLNALTVVKQGGIKIGSNKKLCYVDRVRWESLMNYGLGHGKYDLSLGGNSKDCFQKCLDCRTPAGHGSSGETYCWGGEKTNCQRFCSIPECGSKGCVDGSQNDCCHPQCLGGCTRAGSAKHCRACQRLRLEDGECVQECPGDLKEVNGFICKQECPTSSFNYNGKCVGDCPTGFTKNHTTSKCDKCTVRRCPRVCSVPLFQKSFKINLLSDTAKLKGCTVINGNLEIELRNFQEGANIAQVLNEHLGSIEEVNGHIVVRQSSSLISLNFFKNLKKINPSRRRAFSNRYALAIFDNPKLESLWDFDPNFMIGRFGVFVQLNPQLCLQNVFPLIDDVLKWNRTDERETRVTISKTTNGNARNCDVHLVNITVTETSDHRCKDLCVRVSWPNKITDRRNVLLYSIWYRETTRRDIDEYDDIDACSSDHVWNRHDVYSAKTTSAARKELSANVGGLSAFTLYAFRLEAFVIEHTGVKSSITYFKTKQTIPSPPLGLEVSFLTHSSLQVKWKEPFFANGDITHYIIRYQESRPTRWDKNIDWCKSSSDYRYPNNEVTQRDVSTEKSCPVNTTCDCDENKRKKLGPDAKAALFDKEFQNNILDTVFIKNDNDDDDDGKGKVTTRSTIPSTPSSRVNETMTTARSLCKNGGENSSCASSTPDTSKKPTTVATTILPKTFPMIELNTTEQKIDIPGLEYFTEYSVQVCACNGAGCAENERFKKRCADAVGRTDKNESADAVGNTLVINSTKELSWSAPVKPNGIVLKYDVWVGKANESSANIKCVSETRFDIDDSKPGKFSAKVRAITPVGNGSWSNVVDFTIKEKPLIRGQTTETNDMKVAAIVGISLAATVLLMIIFAIVSYVYIHKRYQKSGKETGVIYASVNPEYLNCSDVYVPDEWEVPREKIKLIRELGNGSFGMVYEGEASDILPNQQCCKVAVKTVSENASIRDKVDFLKEASIMKAFNCNHVVRLLGVVSSGHPVLVVMELMENGDLKTFLRQRRPDSDSEEESLPPPTEKELYQMAAEIADGMAYLSERKFVHRDLAARNCMVSENHICKIGDFGMARDVYETDYYRKGGKGFLPVRWMAPESLKDGVFTSSSDVWSFGIVLWEMATLAEQPYQGKSNEEVMKYVTEGSIMDAPETCPDVLLNLMMCCWEFKPKGRPSFSSIVHNLQQYVSKEFVDRSFYFNQRPRENTDSSCLSTLTEKEDVSDAAKNLELTSTTDDDKTRESVV